MRVQCDDEDDDDGRKCVCVESVVCGFVLMCQANCHHGNPPPDENLQERRVRRSSLGTSYDSL